MSEKIPRGKIQKNNSDNVCIILFLSLYFIFQIHKNALITYILK